MPKSPIVEHWFRGYDSPMKAVVLATREILLAADPRLEEQLKWQSPTFVLGGHLASFFPRSRDHARLMFPLGATIPGEFPSLEVSGATSRVLRLRTLEEVEAARDELTEIVRAWARTRLGEGGAEPEPRAKKRAKVATRAKASPKAAKAYPKAAKASPKAAKASPKAAKASPKAAKASPKVAKASPKVAKASPKVAKASPKVAKASSKAAKTSKTSSPKATRRR